MRLIDYFLFFIPRGLRRGLRAGAVHLDLERRATRSANNVPAGAGGEPFYDPFYRHEKYDGKLYEVDRGRRRGLHLYLHRIYFTTVDASSKTLAGSSRCTRGGHRSGGSRGGVFYRRPVVPDHGGSCNLRSAALQSESNHRGRKRPTFYPSTTSAAIQWRRGISPRRPYIHGADVVDKSFTLGNHPRPVGAGPRALVAANKKQAR